MLALYFPKSCTEAIIMCTANRHLCGSVETNGEQRRTKVSFGRTMILALELLRLANRDVSRQSKLISEEIKPVAIAIIELYLSEGIN